MNSSERIEQGKTECIKVERLNHSLELSHSSPHSGSDFDEQGKAQQMQQLEQIVQSIEYTTYYPSYIPYPSKSDHEQVIRARRAVLSSKLYSAKFKWVPHHYYSLTLKQRADILGAYSTRQLCKSMLMENKAFDPTLFRDDADFKASHPWNMNPLYSQFYLVILQYGAAISVKKLQSEVRALMPASKRLEPSKFEFRVASEHDNDRLTGFLHNAVTPFGMTETVPIIIAKAIVGDPEMSRFIWMGGGHVHLKIGVAATEFLDAMKPLVLDVTEPRLDDLLFSES
jgi:prolyl-tRNA editing enzyme YbaK/EbsC (Cys-tRNA(Pro) deacylase)